MQLFKGLQQPQKKISLKKILKKSLVDLRDLGDICSRLSKY